MHPIHMDCFAQHAFAYMDRQNLTFSADQSGNRANPGISENRPHGVSASGHVLAAGLQLQCLLLHAPPASACSTECRRLSAARRSRAADIVHIFFMCCDGNRRRAEHASRSACASSRCNRRPAGNSDGPGGLSRAVGGVCTCVGCTVPVLPLSLYGRVCCAAGERLHERTHRS